MFFGVFFLYLLFFVVVCKSVLFLLSSILSLPYFCYPFFLILTFVIRSFGIELHLLASLIFLSVCFSFVCVCCVYVGACILYILSKDVYSLYNDETCPFSSVLFHLRHAHMHTRMSDFGA